jgi:hypothetical protein
LKKPVLVGIVFVLVILAVIVYSTMNLAKYKVEVCMQYKGATSCRAASGSTRENTLRAAVENACATIASGVTDTMQCQRSEPVNVRWVKGE